MKAEFINPFIKATYEVVKAAAGIEIKTGKLFIQNSPYGTNDLLIMVGITGEIKGQVILSIPTSIAKAIASNMMMGMPVDEIDEMAKSALSELGNMIMGNAATLLFNQGITIDITPPNLLMGQNIKISSGDMVTVGVPLSCDLGDLTLDISIKE
jgi:chemotaxis protein CheX